MTNPALTGEPGPGGTCRVCGSKLREGTLECGTCGAVYGEANRCPHCRSVAGIEPHKKLRHRCRVCGAPRVPVEDPEVVRSGREIPLLEKAQRDRMKSTAWRLGAGVVAGFGLLSLLIALATLALVSPGLVATLVTLLVVATPFALAGLAWNKGKKLSAEFEQSLERAWTMVAADVLRHRGDELTAEELARTMRIEEPVAEQLLAMLQVQDFIKARVTSEGELVYSTRAPRVRVDERGRAAALAEEEAEQEAEADAKQVQTKPSPRGDAD